MTTELYIENYRLDLTVDISALLTFSIDDIKDFSARSTTWSKTIVLPGTSNNNKLFGHIFQVGQANDYVSSSPNVGYNFNAAKSANCVLFQDQMQTFKGVLRLLQINIIEGLPEYEVQILGTLSGLSSALSGAYLQDLDFSAYNHVYNDSNIVNSWDNPGGSGVYYPLIDYGTYSTNKHDWKIGTFRPALYVKEYVDKIFAAAGKRYISPLFDTPRFKKLIVPHAKKQMTINLSTLFTGNSTNENYGHPPPVVIFGPPELGTLVRFANRTGSGFSSNVDGTIFTYTGSVTTNLTLTFNFEGTYTHDIGTLGEIGISLYKNTPDPFFPLWSAVTSGTPFQVGIGATVTVSIAPGDTLQWRVVNSIANAASNVVFTVSNFVVKSTSGTVAVPILIGDTINISDNIPQNIQQIDFLVGLIKLFNLYITEDKNDENLFYITPYIDYYSTDNTNSVDWSYKLDRSKPIKVKPMSELNAKIYKFKFKQDSDYYNELYRKRYNEGYGDRIYDSEYEFTEQTKSFEIVFSATPLVGYGGEDKVYSTIFKRTGSDASPTEESTDSNIRILQSKKITGVTPWNITTNDGVTTLNTLTRYGYAGHFNNPDAPTDDLNFGATKELLFVLTNGVLNNNQFNVYWSGYMAETTDKDSKLLTGSFRLTAKDILDIDFSKYIYLDGVLFRLNAIRDYNVTKLGICTVELLKVGFVNYTQAAPTDSPPVGNYLLWDDNETLDWDDGEPLLFQ